MVELSSKEQWDALLDSVDTVLLDCDGGWREDVYRVACDCVYLLY